MVRFGEPDGFRTLFQLLLTYGAVNLLPNGKSCKLYGTSLYFIGDRRPFLEDWAALFKLLEERKIKPVISHRYPIYEAARANELLESGAVTGNVVLLAAELV